MARHEEKTENPDAMVTTNELAKMLKLSPRKIRLMKMKSAGELPKAINFGRAVR